MFVTCEIKSEDELEYFLRKLEREKNQDPGLKTGKKNVCDLCNGRPWHWPVRILTLDKDDGIKNVMDDNKQK